MEICVLTMKTIIVQLHSCHVIKTRHNTVLILIIVWIITLLSVMADEESQMAVVSAFMEAGFCNQFGDQNVDVSIYLYFNLSVYLSIYLSV